MKSKAVILAFLILFSTGFPIKAATDEGYGEDETALGQFVDSFENEDNVSVLNNVIVNTTLECVELLYVSGAGNWLEGWNYRKNLTIGNATGAGTNYQVKFIVHFGSGSDSGEDVYLENVSQTDFDDIRWTENDGDTLLDYWLEIKVDSDYGTFWVEIADNLSAASVLIYMYYGNSSVSTISNMGNTFPTFFDDFLGGSLDVGKWDTYGGPGIGLAGGEITITSAAAVVKGIRAKTSLGAGYAVRTRSKIVTGNYAWYAAFSKYSAVTDWLLIFSDTIGDLHAQTRRASGTETDYQSGSKITSYTVFEIRWISANLIQYLINDASYYNATVSGSIPDTDQPSGNFASYLGSMKADWIVIRKVVDPEPGNISWGITETPIKYQANGYAITTDYLSDPLANGSTLVHLTITTIPDGTGILVEFSEDNSTWIFNDWQPLFGGFESIDLRDLNFSMGYHVRYNLSTGNRSITPRLNQSRLISTIGEVGPASPAQNVTGEWIEYNLTQIGVLRGTLDDGNLNSTLDIDGDTYNVSEVVGAPAFTISFNWTGIPDSADCLWIEIYYYYDGNQAHDLDVEIWNFTSSSWVSLDHIVDGADFVWLNTSIYDLRVPNDFVNSSGAVLGRINHADAGNINHDIFIEYLKLIAFVPSDVAIIAAEVFQFFWIVIAIALTMIILVIAKMWFDEGDP